MRRQIVLLLIMACAVSLAGASPRTQVREGNKAAKAGNASDALTRYHRALEQKGDTSIVLYDVGNTLYQQGEYEKAGMAYLGAIDPQGNKELQSENFYNLGNSFFQAQKYDTAMTAYIEALRRNPKDDDARYNLELTRKFLQQQQQQQQKQDQNDQKDKKDQQQQQPPQDQKQDEQQKQQNQPQQEQKQDEQQAQRSPQDMSKEEAERLLNALLQDEQNALRDAKKIKAQARTKREKDW